MEHLEGFIDVAANSLREHLNNRLRAINAETADFDLEFVDDDAFVPGGVDEVIKYPLVEIAAPDWTIRNPDLGQHAWDGDYLLMVRLWYAHPDFNILYRSLMRYGRALVEVLAKRDALGQGITVTTLRGSYRVNPETNERMSYDGGALVILNFSTVEIIP